MASMKPQLHDNYGGRVVVFMLLLILQASGSFTEMPVDKGSTPIAGHCAQKAAVGDALNPSGYDNICDNDKDDSISLLQKSASVKFKLANGEPMDKLTQEEVSGDVVKINESVASDDNASAPMLVAEEKTRQAVVDVNESVVRDANASAVSLAKEEKTSRALVDVNESAPRDNGFDDDEAPWLPLTKDKKTSEAIVDVHESVARDSGAMKLSLSICLASVVLFVGFV
eukprot:gnl/TRDRNA2_/TRDRNA2_42227_c0_seq1.p1 gnl/TRDRNA2_/TRDRNA2_42227_c0~~gnl/TRDRNA2_/TRDRNA2_42227_c0_seq1.p1  ORF type:complete len:248 (+),score=48.39 gnl/TRDRNA2_/TRDRNA2_42227_c0_seq1:66-746(+)